MTRSFDERSEATGRGDDRVEPLLFGGSSGAFEDRGDLIAAVRGLTEEIAALREALAPAPIKAKRISAPKKENEELFQVVVEMWNGIAGRRGFPQVADITDRRQGLILARGHDLVDVFGNPGPVNGFTELFAKVTGSPFLRGENKIGFKADFDWVLNKSNFTKIMEGKYDAPKEAGRFGPTGRSR